jgi:hypothetical protein
MRTLTDGLVAAGYGPSATETLRARRLHAEILARDGRYPAADQLLDAIVVDLGGLKQIPGFERALALDLLGCVRRSEGRASEAIALHEQARSGLLDRLGANHPFVERNALYGLLARLDAEPTDAARTAFDSAGRHYALRFDADSAWRRIIDARLTPSVDGNGPRDGSPMIL